MASARLTWFGVVVEFDHSEVTHIAALTTTGSATAATVTAALTPMGIVGPISAIAAIGAALLGLGAAALNQCNSRQAGISLVVLWVGVPWCKSR